MPASLIHPIDGPSPTIGKQKLKPLIDGIADTLTLDDTKTNDEMAPTGSLLKSYVSVGTLTYETKDLQPACNAWTVVNREHRLPEFGPLITPDTGELGYAVATLSDLQSHFWIRCEFKPHETYPKFVVVRIYVLPDDVARRDVARDNSALKWKLRNLMGGQLETRHGAWHGNGPLARLPHAAGFIVRPEESLSHIFNNLRSPNPDPMKLQDRYDQMAAERILEGSHDEYLGLKTTLYPYQRRSIATMIEKEVQPGWHTDPRLVRTTGPAGDVFLIDRITHQVFREGAQYEDPRGGVLAETMGYGKTLIVLGLVLATKHFTPEIPIDAQRMDLSPSPLGAKSLRMMAADIAHRDNLKWRQFFEEQERQHGRSYETCVKVLERPHVYKQIVQASLLRITRSGPQIREILLCRTTLVIVPNNLFAQWRSEIKKHIDAEKLRVFYVHDRSGPLPSKHELAQYHMILIEKGRFAIEIGHRPIPQTSQDNEPHLPLQDMHFLRLVVDEGHTFAASASNAVIDPLSMVRAHSRWIVTGTPSEGLLGAEMEMLARSNIVGEDVSIRDLSHINHDRVQQDNEDLARLGKIVSRLLQAKPWSNGHESSDLASWNSYMRLGTSPSCEPVVREIMKCLIVRHQAGEIEAELPHLNDEFVFLQPSVFDTFSMDLFTLVMACNAITSERVDEDYIFDRRNWRSLDLLIRNLRRASFYWTGFSAEEARKSLNMVQKYRDEHPSMNDEDRKLVRAAEKVVPVILGDRVWNALVTGHEMGYVVTNLPDKAAAALGIVDVKNFFSNESHVASPVVASRLVGAQNFLAQRMKLGQPDPLRELDDNATRMVKDDHETKTMMDGASVDTAIKLQNRGIPTSGLRGAIKLKTKQIESHKTLGLVRFAAGKRKAKTIPNDEDVLKADEIKLIGTASAKLSYLLEEVIQLYKDEKILIFYEGDDTAWYIAQGLEILAIPHFIYSNGITPAKRNEHLQTFMQDDSVERVMLIDLKQGGHGLNIVCASRIFFVNHVWDGNQRAQAIKRAHRIGQTRPVFVKTLVLRDSIEKSMMEAHSRLGAAGKELADRDVLLGDEIYDVLKAFKFRSKANVLDALAHSEGAYEQFSRVARAPLLFPKVHEYLQKLAPAPGPAIKQEPDEEGQDGETTAGNASRSVEEDSQPSERKKKVARFE